jgi:YD repeat-containing protein
LPGAGQLLLLDSVGASDPNWKLKMPNGETEFYDTSGRLQSIINLAGNAQTMTYDTNDRISRVTINNGDYLQFGYDFDNRVTSITDNTILVWGYRYDL